MNHFAIRKTDFDMNKRTKIAGNNIIGLFVAIETSQGREKLYQTPFFVMARIYNSEQMNK